MARNKVAAQRRAKRPSARGNARPVRVLFTCIGRRVELLRAFQRAANELDVRLECHGTDLNRLAPAMHLVDKAHIVPTIGDRYLDAIDGIVRKHRIELLIPLLDLELAIIAEGSERFAKRGCRAIISSPKVVHICRDKIATYDMLRAAHIDTPATWDWADAVRRRNHKFPYYMKPRTGSAGMGNFVVRDRNELETLGRRVPGAIVQEFVTGIEYTVDVYTGLSGIPRCAVPRRRLEVRSGEVSKGITEKRRDVMATAGRVAEALGECCGVVTVQCIATDDRVRVIEINPRFGGGAPLAIEAGADFPRWLLEEWLGRVPAIRFDGFRSGLAMLRYDSSVFVPRATRLIPRREVPET